MSSILQQKNILFDLLILIHVVGNITMNIEFSFILYIDNQKYVTCSSLINWNTRLYLEKGNVEERGELVEYLEDNHLDDVAPLVLCLGPWQLVLG